MVVNRGFYLTLLAAVSSVSVGCAQTELPPPRPTERANIRLVPLDADRVEEIQFDESVRIRRMPSIETGPIWAAIFVGGEETPNTFEIISTRMVQSGTNRSHWTYSVTGQLVCDGESYPIATEGKRGAQRAIGAAARDAVEQAVGQAAREAKVIADACLQRRLRRVEERIGFGPPDDE